MTATRSRSTPTTRPRHEPPAARPRGGHRRRRSPSCWRSWRSPSRCPPRTPDPHDVPIGAAGPPAASGQVAEMLEQNAPGAFAVTYYPERGRAAGRDPATATSTAASRFGPDRASRHPAHRHRRQPGCRAAAHPDRRRVSRQQTGCRCTPRTSPRRAPTTRAAPAWPRRRCRITLAGILPAIALVLVLPAEVWTRLRRRDRLRRRRRRHDRRAAALRVRVRSTRTSGASPAG